MINFVLIAILFLIVGGIIFYLVRARRRGEKCIGCPYAKMCQSGKCGGACQGTSTTPTPPDTDGEPPTEN